MPKTVTQVEVWSGVIPNSPGGLHTALRPFAEAGVNLSFVLARRQSHNPEAGVVYVAIESPAHRMAAKKAGLAKASNLHALRIEGTDRAGLGATMTQQLMLAGLNLRGLSSITLGKKFVLYLAFDNAGDAKKAMKVLG